MKSKVLISILLLFPIGFISMMAQDAFKNAPLFKPELLQEDYKQFRSILEEEHCCTYEYTSRDELDSIFNSHLLQIDHELTAYEFYGLLAPISARIGCMHTATYLPGRYFVIKPDRLFPLKIKLIDNLVVVVGSYSDSLQIPYGSVLLEINNKPIHEIIATMRNSSSADALNPHFIEAALMKRFSLIYTSLYGLPENFKILYALPGRKTSEEIKLTGASHDAVHQVVFSHFNSPLPECSIWEGDSIASLEVSTFIYYTQLEEFENRMDSIFSMLKEKQIENLVLDLRRNGGGDPFCAASLLSYLESEPLPYFANSYGKYGRLADPIPLGSNPFTGNLFVLIDGSCGSTNGHFCALLKYNQIGKFIGMPSGSSYKCNAGRNTEFRLNNTQMIVTIGRTTYSAAVQEMDKASPIMPEILVKEHYKEFLEGRDPWKEAVYQAIELENSQVH